jgi:hypothetical protein
MSARRMCACGDTGGMYIHAYVTDEVYAAAWRIGYSTYLVDFHVLTTVCGEGKALAIFASYFSKGVRRGTS